MKKLFILLILGGFTLPLASCGYAVLGGLAGGVYVASLISDSHKEKQEEEKRKEWAKQQAIEEARKAKLKLAEENKQREILTSQLKKLKLDIDPEDLRVIMYSNDSSKNMCDKYLASLGEFSSCSYQGKNLPQYVVVSPTDTNYWKIFQHTEGGALIQYYNSNFEAPNYPMIFFSNKNGIEGVDGQYLGRYYLLETLGTITYNTSVGGTNTVYSLKILGEIKL